MDNEAVKQMIDKKPELLRAIAKQPPKKDDGQSPLQLAVKCGNYEIAAFLLEKGADVNFMENPDTCCRSLQMPVLHYAVIAAVTACRHSRRVIQDGIEVIREFSTKEAADASFDVLKRIIEKGADLKARDSFGVSAAERLCKTAESILPKYTPGAGMEDDSVIVKDELKRDLRRIFLLLRAYGEKFDDKAVRDYLLFEDHPLAEFLKPVI